MTQMLELIPNSIMSSYRSVQKSQTILINTQSHSLEKKWKRDYKVWFWPITFPSASASDRGTENAFR